jgi:16S rRNA G966 N2-methylase RsmD
VKNVENVVNDLVGYKNLKIVQCNKYFNFSLDSVLLPNFVTIKEGTKKIIDFGCGNCPIPLILTTRTNAEIYGIEIQKEIYNLAQETIKINNLESRITLINDDIKNTNKLFDAGIFDVVLSNPPYRRLQAFLLFAQYINRFHNLSSIKVFHIIHLFLWDLVKGFDSLPSKCLLHLNLLKIKNNIFSCHKDLHQKLLWLYL